MLFTLSLIIANIYCFKTKKYLYLFVPCMLFLPEYYGIEISHSLPILTVTRIMFLVLYIYAIINRRKSLSIHKFRLKSIPLEYKFLSAYFIIRIVDNCYYLSKYGQAVKTIFSIVVEQLFFLLAIYLLSPTKEELHTLVKCIVWSATSLFVIGILESYTYIRPFDALYTVSRAMLNDHYERLGLLRATTTLGLPGIFGNMCLLMLPLIFYLYRTTRQKKYVVIIFLDFWAIIQSGSRSDIFFFVAVNILYFAYIVIRKNDFVAYIKNVSIISFSLILVIGILSAINPKLFYYYEGFFISNAKVLGIEIESDNDDDVPYESTEGNVRAVSSRTYQFSGIKYAMNINPLFGLGNGSLQNGDVYYYSFNEWRPSSTFDVGLVEILVTEGIIGLIGHIALLLFMLTILIQKKLYNNMPLELFSIFILWPVTYLISTLSTANLYKFLIVIVMYFLFYDSFSIKSEGI